MKSLKFILLVFISIHCKATDYIELISNPAVSKLLWDSPASLAQTYLSSSIKQNFADTFRSVNKSTVGHVMLHLDCVDSKNKRHNFYTGMSGLEDRDDSLHELLVAESGLKILFSGTDDGYIETDDEVRDLIFHHYPRKDYEKNEEVIIKSPRFIRFPVTSHQCDDAIDVVKTYKKISFQSAKQNLSVLPESEKLYFDFTTDAYQSYLTHKINPQSPLSGVCSSFGVAVLKAAGVYDNTMDIFWKRHIEASIDKIGGIDPNTGNAFKLPISKLLNLKNSNWKTPGVPIKNLDIYDPEKIWNFITGVNLCVSQLQISNAKESVLCTEDLMSWVKENLNRIKGDVQSTITANFEKNLPITGPRVFPPVIKTSEYKKTKAIEGIEFSSLITTQMISITNAQQEKNTPLTPSCSNQDDDSDDDSDECE